MKADIVSEEDITLMVFSFYAEVRKDAVLASVFDEVIKDNWDSHLQTMCRFWSTMLLYTRTYKADPMMKHLALPLSAAHFERWLVLFDTTVDSLFEGSNANAAKIRAANIARIMQAVIIKK